MSATITFDDYTEQNIETVLINGTRVSCIFFDNVSTVSIYIPLLEDGFAKKIKVKTTKTFFEMINSEWIDVTLLSSNTLLKGIFFKAHKYDDLSPLLALDMRPIINAEIEKENSTNKKEEIDKVFIKINRLRELTSYDFYNRTDRDIIYATKLLLDHDRNFITKYSKTLDRISHNNIITVPGQAELHKYTDILSTGDVYCMVIKYIYGSGENKDIIKAFINEGIDRLKEDGHFICTLGMINRMIGCFVHLDSDKILGDEILTDSNVVVEITNNIYKYVFGDKNEKELKNIKIYLDDNDISDIPYNIKKSKNVDGNLFNCYLKDMYFEYGELLDRKKISEAIAEILAVIKDEL